MAFKLKISNAPVKHVDKNSLSVLILGFLVWWCAIHLLAYERYGKVARCQTMNR